jgi:WD40 repeat protein
MDRPIESVSLAAESSLCVTTTRNQTAVWDLESGRLAKLFISAQRAAVVSQALISRDGSMVLTAEAPLLMLWEMAKDTPVCQQSLGDIQQLLLNEDDGKVIAVVKSAVNKGLVVCLTLPQLQEVWRFEYNLKRVVPAVLTVGGLFLAVPAADKSGDVMGVYHAKTGTLLYNLQLKYANYREIRQVVALPHDPNQVAIIDDDKGNILDLKKKTLVRSVPRWNGMATKNGKKGLFAPSRGGLEILDLKNGKTTKTLIPRVAEGVFDVKVFFTENDKYVVYYHSGHRTIRLFRVKDGKMLANYKASAEIKTMVSTPEGDAIVMGAVDGSLTTLAIADPEDDEHLEVLQDLASRAIDVKPPAPAEDEKPANGGPAINTKNAMGTALQVARFVAKARGAQKSRACVLS